MAYKRPHHHPTRQGVNEEDEETVYITPLGAAKEVGRSCLILKYKGRTIMLDCGIHPGRTGDDSLPFFDSGPDAADIDLILISHFHLDHAASLPYFTEKVQGGAFKGRIFATHPTKAIMRLMLQNHIRTDTVRLAADGTTPDEGQQEAPLYTEADLLACLDKIEVIDFQQRMEHRGIRFWCYNAGHVLGAAMFMIEIGGLRVLYTGDYSMEDDRHLMAAEVPYQYTPDILIVESTYGVQNHPPKEERERRFTDEVAKIVRRGGRCLLPVFALGRAQELMLILDEYWHAHKDLQKVPVYFASYTSEKAHRVYETYVNMMNAHVRQQMDLVNPFRFAFIKNCRSVGDIDDFQPAVVLASPGFLNSGPSRQLFDRWCSSDANGLVMTGYTQEGTLARKLLTHPEVVEDLRGRPQPLKASVESISFSAHVDYRQNEEFMKRVKSQIIVLVHGEQNQMNELKRALVRTIGSHNPSQGGYGANILTPDLCSNIQLTIPQRKTARILGKLAEAPLEPGQALFDAVLVSRSFTTRLLTPADLPTYTQLRPGGVSQKVHFPFHQSKETLRAFLEELFEGGIEELVEEEAAFPSLSSLHLSARATATGSGGGGGGGGMGVVGGGRRTPVSGGIEEEREGGKKEGVCALRINGVVVFHLDRRGGGGRGCLVWDGGPVADMVADAVLALAMEAQVSPMALRMTSVPCCAHRRGGKKGGRELDEEKEAAGAGAVAVAEEKEEVEAEEEGKKTETRGRGKGEKKEEEEQEEEEKEEEETPPIKPEGDEDGAQKEKQQLQHQQGISRSSRSGASTTTNKSKADPHTRKLRRLYRILSSVYGTSSLSLDLSILQITLSLPGGSECRVRLEVGLEGGKEGGQGRMEVTADDGVVLEQVRNVVRRVGGTLNDKVVAAVGVGGGGYGGSGAGRGEGEMEEEEEGREVGMDEGVGEVVKKEEVAEEEER